jgi:hypothetical protein
MHPLYKFLTEKDRNGYKDSSVMEFPEIFNW